MSSLHAAGIARLCFAVTHATHLPYFQNTLAPAPLQFLNWDTVSRRRIDLIGRKDCGDQVVVHEFDFAKKRQVVYDHKVREQCKSNCVRHVAAAETDAYM